MYKRMKDSVKSVKSLIPKGLLLTAFIVCLQTAGTPCAAAELPNIVIVYTDDLGYGDLSIYNPKAAYQTPRIDQLAKEGIMFTDAHSPSTICSPSRYGLFSGQQIYRSTGRGGGAFEGPGGPSYLKPGTLTLGEMLRSKGYRTGVFGKWHVGLTWYDKNGKRLGGGFANSKLIDYEQSTPLIDGPNNRGFDESFVTPNCPNTDPLYVYIENGMVETPATVRHRRGNLPNLDGWLWDNDEGIMSVGYDFENADKIFYNKTINFINDHLKRYPKRPFFAVLSTQIAHAPVLPAEEFRGATTGGPRGDFVYELDVLVGRLLDKLKELGIDDNTLVLFNSDNGPETVHYHRMLQEYNHNASGPWRGMKRDGWEGGHRVPFIARWPRAIPAGQVTTQMTNTTDIFATLASVVGYQLKEQDATDSFDMLPVMLGTQSENESIRPYLLTQSFRGEFQIRLGKWKYLDHKGSGGNNYTGMLTRYMLPEKEPNAPGQLYDLDNDPDETTNLYFKESDKRKELQQLLDKLKKSGRSAPKERKPIGIENIPVILNNAASNEPAAADSNPITASIYGPLASSETEFDIFLTFSTSVSGLEITDFQVANGTVLSITEQGRRDFAGRYYKASVRASSPGTVTISLPDRVVHDAHKTERVNASSDPFVVQCTSDFVQGWVIDDQASWKAATGMASHFKITDGFAEPAANTARFSSVIKTFPVKRKAAAITFIQSPVWDNWKDVPNLGPSDAGDAPILLPISDKAYYFLGLGSTGGYHAWHSTDMVHWTDYGPVTPPVHRWVTSAEYKDGLFYIYVDHPNDHTPHLYIDDDLKDGKIGKFKGMAFNDPTHGSDCGVIRDNADGLFHIIHEDWTPINARRHSWDSPLAGHTSSADGFSGFQPAEHVPPIDFRTQPTGEFGTYNHPHVAGTHIHNPCYYEIHTPEQDAYGDWTAVKVGDRYYLFSDCDPVQGRMTVARFTSDSIYKQYQRVGTLGSGHPDPTIGFAEGRFYLITQMRTDYVSPGPWVEGVQARGGVDIDNDGIIDQWTGWQAISETYDYTPGYARVVDVAPARLDLSGLPEGYGFQFEFTIDNTVVSGVSPIMDRVEINFKR